MNDQSEENQSLDMRVLHYTSDEIAMRQPSNAVSDKITKVSAKDILTEEPNPTELYLYNQPQESLRQPDIEASVENQQPFMAAALNYDDKHNGTQYNNGLNSHIDSNEDITNESSHDVRYDKGGNNHNLASQPTLTPLKQRDRHGYMENRRHPQVLGMEQSPTTNTTTTTSSESSVLASHEMQSPDTLLTRTNFDIRGINEVGDSTEQPFYVNAKQYYRILKRRYTRAKLEENLRISRERRPYLHESRHKHAMRRPRGQGGRFLTLAEIEAMKSKDSSVSSSSSSSSTPNIKSESEHIGSGPRLVEKHGPEPKPKILKPADGASR